MGTRGYPDLSRRDFIAASAAAAGLHVRSGSQPAAAQGAAEKKEFQYDSIRALDEREDPSLTLETDELVVKVIDNTALKRRPGDFWLQQGYSHFLGYHGIRALWRKDEQRNIVAPFVSWLNLQTVRIEGVELDPVDSRARAGVGRGWPLSLAKEDRGAVLKIEKLPVSGVEYQLRLRPSGADALDFEVEFKLHKKTKDKAAFSASWPCYMSTYDEVALRVPVGKEDQLEWQSFGEKESCVLGEPVNYQHRQRAFHPPAPPTFTLAYGRIGTHVLALMMSRPEVGFFVVNTGGHPSWSPVQNPAWDFALRLPDYAVGKPFGFRGRLIYQRWKNSEDILARYKEWRKSNDQ